MKVEYAVIIVAIMIFAVLIVAAAKIDDANAAAVPTETTTAEPELDVTPFYNVPMPAEHQLIVHNLCEISGLSEPFVYGVIFAESGFDPAAVNPKTGCHGYMQLDPELYPADQYGTPSRNLYAGICLLAELSQEFEDPVTVLLCYNHGRTGARRLIDRGVTSTAYTDKVLAYAERLTSTARLYEEVYK